MAVALEFLAYACVRVAWLLAEWTPLPLLKRLLMPLSSMIMAVTRRDTAKLNLRTAFPDWSDQEIERCAVEAGRYWGRLAAEVTHGSELAGAVAERSIQPDLECFNQARDGGKGVLILTAHIGNFELMARLVARFVPRFAVLHRVFRNRFFERFYAGEREAVNIDVLRRAAGMRTALRILRSGGAVAVALDQNQRPGRGIFVEMFGSPACTSTVLARLSLASGLPVLPMFAVWEGEQIELVVSTPISPTGVGSPATGLVTREDKVRALTIRYTEEIEKVVRAYPEQWNWGHRRWKTRPEPEGQADESRRAASA